MYSKIEKKNYFFLTFFRNLSNIWNKFIKKMICGNIKILR